MRSPLLYIQRPPRYIIIKVSLGRLDPKEDFLEKKLSPRLVMSNYTWLQEYDMWNYFIMRW